MFRDELIDYYNRCITFGLPCIYENWEYKVENGLVYLTNYFGKVDEDFKILSGVDALSLDVLFDGCKRLKKLDLNEVSYLLKSENLQSFLLEEIIAPNLKVIGDESLLGCESLKTFIGDKVEKVGINSFRDCSNLELVSLNEVLFLDNSSFMECSKLKNISIPKVEYIGSFAFAGCDELIDVSINDGTIIADAAFRWCGKLNKNISILN